MEHEQGEEVLGRDGSGSVFSAFGMAITKDDHAVPAPQNILLADDAPVQVAAKINRLTTFDLAPSTQKSEQETRRTLEKLTEAGLVDAHGSGWGRTYTLNAHVYRKAGQKAGYIHQAGFDPIQQEQMVLRFIDEHGTIQRADVMELCRLSAPQAYHLLKRLEKEKMVEQHGVKRYSYYTRLT